MRYHHRPIIASLLACAAAPSILAGPLDPPAGPIAPTMKTLAQVEPRLELNQTNAPGDASNMLIISQPGSYYLTGNLSISGTKNAIKISTSNVTIDLNGFTIQGTPATPTSGIVQGAPKISGIVIQNGIIRDFGGDGIELIDWNDPASSASNGRISHLTLLNNADSGIHVSQCWIIDACLSDQNGGYAGISAGPRSTIMRSTSRRSKQCGFAIQDGEIRDCVASENNQTYFEDYEFPGISSTNSLVIDCVANDNLTSGIYGERMVRCTADSNGGNGFNVAGGSAIECTANFNGVHGFSISAASRVTDCHATSNGRDAGITTGAGFAIGGSGSTIANNSAANNDRGFSASNAGNFIHNNTASGNATNYVISSGNRVGIIVVPTSSAAINGNTGGGMGTTDPHANFAQ